MLTPRERRRWLGVCAVLAGLLVFQGVFFDYSDRYIKAYMAVLILALGWMVPRAMVLCIAGVLVLQATLPLALGFRGICGQPSGTVSEVRSGMTRSDVLALVGAPDLVVANREELFSLEIGYALPSPYRYRHEGPVEVYYDSCDAAYWFFYEKDRVVDVFVGGS